MEKRRIGIERELSWLQFNERVLQEAQDMRNPLLEQLRFLGIFSNNLDEFFKVRFATLRRDFNSLLSVANLTLKNSSKLLEKIPKNLKRSSKGTWLSCASCSTRSLNCNHESSLSIPILLFSILQKCDVYWDWMLRNRNLLVKILIFNYKPFSENDISVNTF